MGKINNSWPADLFVHANFSRFIFGMYRFFTAQIGVPWAAIIIIRVRFWLICLLFKKCRNLQDISRENYIKLKQRSLMTIHTHIYIKQNNLLQRKPWASFCHLLYYSHHWVSRKRMKSRLIQTKNEESRMYTTESFRSGLTAQLYWHSQTNFRKLSSNLLIYVEANF